jgi:hypothetical protein
VQKPASSAGKHASSKGIAAKDVSFKDGMFRHSDLVSSLTPAQDGYISMGLGSTKAVL